MLAPVIASRRWFATSVEAAARASKTSDFFKQRWKTNLFSKSKKPSLPASPIVSSDVSIRIDSRESALIDALTRVSPLVAFEPLQLTEGDIEISGGGKRIVIERKTVDDLYNSIRTNRLVDQIGRIYEAASRMPPSVQTVCVLVLEGPLSCGAANTSPAVYQAVSKMYHSLLLRDRISVIRTDNVLETARTVLALADRVGKIFATPNEYSALVHVERTGRKINGLNVPYLKLLMSIRGVSAHRAQAIADAYPSVEKLLENMKAPGGTLRLANLVALSAGRTVGTPLGTATASNIAEALLGPDHREVALFKLVKYVIGNSKLVNGEAVRVATAFGSIQNLRSQFLSSTSLVLPESLAAHLTELVDDPSTLLVGLKGVRLISTSTAERITEDFRNVRGLHAALNGKTVEESVSVIRLIGTVQSGRKRMISKAAALNIMNWCFSEGFLSKP